MNYQSTNNYVLSQVFIGQVDGQKRFLYSIHKGEQYQLIPDISHMDMGIPETKPSYKNVFYEKGQVKIICSLQEFIEREGIEPLLMNAKHEYVIKVSYSKIQLIKDTVANKKRKFASSLSKLEALANFTASIVCDELGFNVAVHPMTTIIDVSKVQNIAVPATKVARFKEELAKYIYTQFLTEQRETIFQDSKERSSCIESCLNFSHIQSTRELLGNLVSVQPDLRTGTVSVKKELLKPELIQQPTEFQKIHILSVK